MGKKNKKPKETKKCELCGATELYKSLTICKPCWIDVALYDEIHEDRIRYMGGDNE
jgi:ribosomal protein S14